MPSHAELQPLADFLNADKVDYMRHEGMFFEIGRHTRALHGAFLWNTTRGQGCGGIRLREYTTAEEYIRDGMRLATGMGRKSALAGLWAGGGKGVIASPPEMTVVDVSEIPDIPFGPEWYSSFHLLCAFFAPSLNILSAPLTRGVCAMAGN